MFVSTPLSSISRRHSCTFANDPLRFYKEAWYLHFKYVAPRVCNSLDDLFVVVSSLQINKKKQAVKQAVEDVVSQASPAAVFHSAFFFGRERPLSSGRRLRDVGNPAES